MERVHAVMAPLSRLWRRGLWAMLLLSASSLCAAAPGGEGVLRAVGEQCFKTRSHAVPEICGTLEIRWKLWAMMGEPVGNYGLVWSLTSLRLRQGDGTGSKAYRLQDLPRALAKAAEGSELMVEGLAYVQNSSVGLLAVAFDTGAPARPNGKASFNVPGSPDWGAFLIQGSSSGAGLKGWCDAKTRSHAAASQAKAIMKAGIQLGQLQLCPTTSASAGNLDAAIQKHCRRGKDTFCPAKAARGKVDPPADATSRQIEDAFAQMEKTSGRKAPTAGVDTGFPGLDERLKAADDARQWQLEQQALARQAQARREEATQFCQGLQRQRDACMKDTCGAEPATTVCTQQRRDDSAPTGCAPGRSCLVIPTFVCLARAPNPAHDQWRACTAKPVAHCAAMADASTATVAQCVEQRIQARK